MGGGGGGIMFKFLNVFSFILLKGHDRDFRQIFCSSFIIYNALGLFLS